MHASSPVASRRRTSQQSITAADDDANYHVPRGATVHVDPPRPPLPTRRPSLRLGDNPHSLPSDRRGSHDKKREAEVQRQRRAPPLALSAADTMDVPRYVAARPSMSRSSNTTTNSSSQLSSAASSPAARHRRLSIGTAAAAAGADQGRLTDNSSGLPTAASALSTPPSETQPIDTRRMTREEQEAVRQREIDRLNAWEREKAQRPPRQLSNASQVAAAAADARQQLGQPSYVGITAKKAVAEARYEAEHGYTQLVTDLHTRLGVLPKAPAGVTPEQARATASPTAKGKKMTATAAAVVEDVADKLLALRRAEMAEMVARLRRLLAEGNVTATPSEIPIIPASGVLGAATRTPCPACDFCIELNSEEAITAYLIPILKALVSERVVMPMAGRRGSVSVSSSAASDSAATLDSFHIHSSSSSKGGTTRGERRATHGGESADYGPSRYAVPRCFRLELVPFGLQRLSIHVSVHNYLAEHFYKAHAQRQERLFSLAIDTPYPEQWPAWTLADKTRLLHRVIDDLLHGGPHPPAPAVTEAIAIFPAHVDATRDALWNSIWSARSVWQLLTVPEDAIASYFGAEVMFYYAWMNHYARWLLGAGVLGVTVSALSAVRLVDPMVMAGDVAAVAPSSAIAAAVFAVRRGVQATLDAALLPAFIVVMIIGSVLCIKTWERRCSLLTMKYHLFQQEGKDEPRRDFHGTPGRNPVTGEAQLVYPAWYRAMVLQPLAWAVVVAFMAGTVVIMICSLNLDGMISSPDSRLAIPFLRAYTLNGNALDATVHPVLAMLPRIGYSVCIATLSSVFTALATWLTRMENYRYRGEFVRALTLKRVAFEFVNSYAKLIFIAFGRSSMPELASNLQSILYVAVLSRLLSDTIVPFFITHRQRVARRLLRQHPQQTAAAAAPPLKQENGEADKDSNNTSSSSRPTVMSSRSAGAEHGGSEASPLDEVDELLDPYDVYVDFIEMIIQFGYILLFAAAYPLASFVALLSNVVEVRSDLFKMCYVVRRPVPRLGLQENATWCGVMRVFAMASVITNTFLLAFTSHQMARWFPEYFITNHTAAALPHGAMASAASVASLANAADGASVGIDMIPGTGRVVMFYAMVMEHVMGLVAVFLLWRIPSTPRVVRHYIERRMHERMSRS